MKRILSQPDFRRFRTAGNRQSQIGNTTAPNASGAVSARDGVTLTEVLMSLMIMSIGVSAVAVLFPISVLRSVQATQLTNSAILKYNVEALIQMRPELVFDPDGDGNLVEHIGSKLESRYVVDPSGYYAMTDLSLGYIGNPFNPPASRGFADWFGNTDTNADGIPDTLVGLPRFDGGVRARSVSSFPPDGLRPDPNAYPEEARALRILASDLTNLGDGWTTIVDSYVDGFLLNDGNVASAPSYINPDAFPNDLGLVVGVRLPEDIDLHDVASSELLIPATAPQRIPDPEHYRIVVYSIDGRFSVALPLLSVVPQNSPPTPLSPNRNTVRWGERPGEDFNNNLFTDSRQLPIQFVDPATGRFVAGRVILQAKREHDFNWLLTVRRSPDGDANGIDVVVTFNKTIAPADERAYSADFIGGSEQVNILQDGGLESPGGDVAEPFLKRGGYVFDLENARWYRVRDYSDLTTVNVNGTSGAGYVVTLETPVIENSIGGKAVFLPGVVDVYPMDSLRFPKRL